MLQLGLFEPTAPVGDVLKEEGQAKVLGPEPAEAWKDLFLLCVAGLAAGVEITADEVVDVIGPPPASPNAIGAAMSAASKSGLVKPCGYQKSTKPSRHSAVVRVWRREA